MRFRVIFTTVCVFSLACAAWAEESDFDAASETHSKNWAKACEEIRQSMRDALDVNPNADAKYSAAPTTPAPVSAVWALQVGPAKLPIFPAPHYKGERVVHNKDRVSYEIHHGRSFKMQVLVTPSVRSGDSVDTAAQFYPESFGLFEMQLDAFRYSLADLKCKSSKTEMRAALGLFMKQVLTRPDPEYKVYKADLGKPGWVETFHGLKNDHYYFQATTDDGRYHVAIRYDFADHKLYEKAAPYLWATVKHRHMTSEDSPKWLAKLEKSLATDMDSIAAGGRALASRGSKKHH
jgi:hypothetical protein